MSNIYIYLLQPYPINTSLVGQQAALLAASSQPTYLSPVTGTQPTRAVYTHNPPNAHKCRVKPMCICVLHGTVCTTLQPVSSQLTYLSLYTGAQNPPVYTAVLNIHTTHLYSVHVYCATSTFIHSLAVYVHIQFTCVQ